MDKMSLFKNISESVVNGELPDNYSLPSISDNKDEIRWADGAMDGVGIYHMSFPTPGEEDKTLMIKAVRTASNGDFDNADKLFCKLGDNIHTIYIIDEIQSYIIDHKDNLSAGNLYEYGYHAVVDSSNRECVKIGLSLLELFNTESHEELKSIVRTIGLSDEFSLFAIFVMLKWKDGNDEVWQLAKKIHGWGRIHAVERIEPATAEMKRWFLLDAVHNDVMDAYSAFSCWQKSNAEAILKCNPTREELSGIRDIIEGMLDEGPVPGISRIENKEDCIISFLNAEEKLISEPEDYDTIRSICIYFDDDENNNPEIVSQCKKLLSTEK